MQARRALLPSDGGRRCDSCSRLVGEVLAVRLQVLRLLLHLEVILLLLLRRELLQLLRGEWLVQQGPPLRLPRNHGCMHLRCCVMHRVVSLRQKLLRVRVCVCVFFLAYAHERSRVNVGVPVRARAHGLFGRRVLRVGAAFRCRPSNGKCAYALHMCTSGCIMRF